MTDRELMQMALDTLDKLLDKLNADICDNSGIWDEYCDGGNAMQALRARLAQPEPELVAWLFQNEETGLTECVDTQQVEWGFEKNNPRWQKIAPLYTSPPQREWQGLTDDERTYIAWESNNGPECVAMTEAKLKEKNT